MAKHLDDIRTLPELGKDDFYLACRGGDMVFCWGREEISRTIEGFTDGPSHVLMIWIPPWSSEWLTLESTFDRGVHVGRFGDYIDRYDGDLVLARRPELGQKQIEAELNDGFALLDDKYDWVEEVSMAARKLRLFSGLPAIKPAKELYCSGLMQAIALRTIPFEVAGPDWATPEQIYTDPSVQAVCALWREANHG